MASVSSSSSNPSSQAVTEAKHVAYYDKTYNERSFKSQEVQVEPPARQLENPPTIYPELDRYRHVKQYSDASDKQSLQVPPLATLGLRPTPPSVLFSGSSSQRSASPSKWSSSPGPGPYSRDTTPTSNSSQSPNLITTGRLITKGRQHGPALNRPPVTRRRLGGISGDAGASSLDPQGLVAVRETLNSSSSSSTVSAVRDGENNTKRGRQETHLSPSLPVSRLHFDKLDEESLLKSRGQGRPSLQSAHGAHPSQFVPPFKQDPPRRPSRVGVPDMQLPPGISAYYRSPERHELKNPTNTRASNASSLRAKIESMASLPVVWAEFFSRKKKAPVSDAEGKNAANQSARKGPAGPEHEGYGRLVVTPRRAGEASTLVRDAHNPWNWQGLNDTNPFLADRMSPVVIFGGVTNKNPRTEPPRIKSGPSLTQGRPSLDSRAGSEIPRTTLEEAGNTSWSTIVPQTTGGQSDYNDSNRTMKSTLDFRTSRQRPRNSSNNSLRVPHPINSSGFANSSMTSFDASVMSISDSAVKTKNDDAKLKDLAHPAPRKLSNKERLPRRWNFAGRSQNQASRKENVLSYTIIDPSEHDGDVADISKPTPKSAYLSPGQGRKLPQIGISSQIAPDTLGKPDLNSAVNGPSPSRLMKSSMQRNGSNGSGTLFSSSSDATTTAAEASFQTTQPQPEQFSSRARTQFLSTGVTAGITGPEDPPAEDEIWDEYDDLLEDSGPRLSTTSSRGMPFHLERYQTREIDLKSPTPVPDSNKISTLSAVSASSADMTERTRMAIQSHARPSTPNSLSETVSSHGGQDVTTSVGPPPLSTSRRSSTSSYKTKSSNSGLSPFDEALQINIRIGSMTVSKWLTFGHVLFSDARHELTPADNKVPQHSVLVIDGLGNDDWSFYAAETYSGATFFNLSPRAPLPAELQNADGFPTSPPNHHQVQYLSQLETFPFVSHSFTSVVLRFPVAAPESHYRNILTEAKRVLQPDGHFELSILDADLNNMGTIGRRAIRELKERTFAEIEDINLSPTADLLIRLLGHYGFTEIKTARVGIPVASSLDHLPSNEPDKAKAAEERKRQRKNPPSLAEMMSENSGAADEGITKMVSRVGRWWYTCCYEKTAGVATHKSIWANKALLRECKELGTSLKLTVCCARAP